ncbi:MAG: DUF2442 domain-containing protein [Candidatus Brocadiaceae bacterium]|nr:DUF2442 domain-containing protein [Candidatus Brocadiaceae bacterium]
MVFTGIFDVSPYLELEAFTELKNQDAFRKVMNGKYFIEWDCGVDLSADTIDYRNLLELRNILNSLTSYWAVHFSMDEDVDLPPEEIVRNFNKEPKTWSTRFIIKELFFSRKNPDILFNYHKTTKNLTNENSTNIY